MICTQNYSSVAQFSPWAFVMLMNITKRPLSKSCDREAIRDQGPISQTICNHACNYHGNVMPIVMVVMVVACKKHYIWFVNPAQGHNV